LYHLPRRGASHATKNRALAAITATPATNHNTLYAKAKLVGPLLDDEHGTCPKTPKLSFRCNRGRAER
jgi:hypothetical protein